jgi:hypothetical protein
MESERHWPQGQHARAVARITRARHCVTSNVAAPACPRCRRQCTLCSPSARCWNAHVPSPLTSLCLLPLTNTQTTAGRDRRVVCPGGGGAAAAATGSAGPRALAARRGHAPGELVGTCLHCERNRFVSVQRIVRQRQFGMYRLAATAATHLSCERTHLYRFTRGFQPIGANHPSRMHRLQLHN